MRTWTRAGVAAAAALVGVGTAFAVTAASAGSNTGAAHATAHDSALATDLTRLDRTAVWDQVARLDLKFPTFHPEGLVVTDTRIYLSSTEIIEPTVKYPSPVDGYDRTPGKGVGHLFVMNRTGQLLHDVKLGHGIVYHPGGIDIDGDDILVPVAQYRPHSSAEIYRVNVDTLKPVLQFSVNDHIGGIVYDRADHRLVGNNWGSRIFYDWTRSGRTTKVWANPQNTLDFQDCQYVPSGKMACGGITALPQTPTAGGSAASYELGGVALLDLHAHRMVNMVPFQKWSSAGHVMTRNPVKLVADGRTITMWAAPDNGEDVAGTQLFTFRTTLPAS